MEMACPCQAEMGCCRKGRAWGLGLGFLSCCLRGGSLEIEAGQAECLRSSGGGGWRAFSSSRPACSCSHPLRSQGKRKVEAWPLPLSSLRPLCRNEGLPSPSAVWLLRGQCLALWGCGFLILFGLWSFVQGMFPGSPTSTKQPFEECMGLLRRVQKPGICLFLHGWASGESPFTFVLTDVHYIWPLPCASECMAFKKKITVFFLWFKKFSFVSSKAIQIKKL